MTETGGERGEEGRGGEGGGGGRRRRRRREMRPGSEGGSIRCEGDRVRERLFIYLYMSMVTWGQREKTIEI